MNYHTNVIKFVWRQLRKPTRVTLDAIISQNLQKTPPTFPHSLKSPLCSSVSITLPVAS